MSSFSGRGLAVLGGIALVVASLASPGTQARTLNPDKPADALTIARKVACSTIDGKNIVYWWHGDAFARRTGERDKLLFKVEGMNVRACVKDTHPDRGRGYRMVSRELLFYKDPKTGELLEEWENPWSGETVTVMHVANDPVNFASYTTGRDGKPARWDGMITEDSWRQNVTVPLFYPNPLAGDFQAEIGGTYHATEMFNFLGSRKDLLDSRLDTAAAHVGWVRMSDWLPWMKMNGRDGTLYMHTAGLKLSGFEALPEQMKREIRKNYPKYEQAPPLDDTRKNMTSWMYYKDVIEGRVKLPGSD